MFRVGIKTCLSNRLQTKVVEKHEAKNNIKSRNIFRNFDTACKVLDNIVSKKII